MKRCKGFCAIECISQYNSGICSDCIFENSSECVKKGNYELV